ncbi:MAG TPA: anti-sigma regulatory factor [Verrucomicrobiae bacterium]|nr:anti-sigma regulatory factor [Verrucomicrobiae bacterium]
MVAIQHRTRKTSRARRRGIACRSEPTPLPAEKKGARLIVRSSPDIVQARQLARELATEMGFSGSDVTRIASAISEIARNILDYAREGEIAFQSLPQGRGLQITARDHGPGIPDVSLAMQYGYSSGNGLGVGLPGARWLMDEFNIQSAPGKGTVVTMTKWLA